MGLMLGWHSLDLFKPAQLQTFYGFNFSTYVHLDTAQSQDTDRYLLLDLLGALLGPQVSKG